MICFVTGKPNGFLKTLASTITCPLSDEVSAHLTLNSLKEPVWKSLMLRVDDFITRKDLFIKELAAVRKFPDVLTDSEVVKLMESQLRAGDFDMERVSLEIEQAAIGHRLLLEMKARFRETGILS